MIQFNCNLDFRFNKIYSQFNKVKLLMKPVLFIQATTAGY